MTNWFGTVAACAAACALVAGCSGSEPPAAAPPATATPQISQTPEPTSKPALTVAQYRAQLVGLEQRIKPLFARAMTAATLPATDAARVRLAVALERERTAIARVVPPSTLTAEHQSLIGVLDAHRELRTKYSTATVERTSECNLPRTVPELLYLARTDIWFTVGGSKLDDLGAALRGKAQITFGKMMMPPVPKEPAAQNRRGVNGKVLQRSGPRGSGRLRIVNGTDSDVVVAAALGEPRKPLASIYVRAHSRATLTGLGDMYSVYFKSGSDWDARRRSFTRGCEYQSFLRIFDARSTWEVSLKKTAGGNALTNTVRPF